MAPVEPRPEFSVGPLDVLVLLQYQFLVLVGSPNLRQHVGSHCVHTQWLRHAWHFGRKSARHARIR